MLLVEDLRARIIDDDVFVGSDEAAEVNTTFVSLIASCQLQGIEPWSYLRDLFILLPLWPRSRVLELAPAHWHKTLEQKDTQQRLAGDVYRRASIGELVPPRSTARGAPKHHRGRRRPRGAVLSWPPDAYGP